MFTEQRFQIPTPPNVPESIPQPKSTQDILEVSRAHFQKSYQSSINEDAEYTEVYPKNEDENIDIFEPDKEQESVDAAFDRLKYRLFGNFKTTANIRAEHQIDHSNSPESVEITYSTPFNGRREVISIRFLVQGVLEVEEVMTIVITRNLDQDSQIFVSEKPGFGLSSRNFIIKDAKSLQSFTTDMVQRYKLPFRIDL